MFGKIVRGFGNLFGLTVIIGVLSGMTWFVGTMVSFAFAPRWDERNYYGEDYTWLQQHHTIIGQIAGALFFLGLPSLIYACYKDCEENDGEETEG